MKRFTVLFIIFIMLFNVGTSVFATEENIYVYDEADILSDEKEQKISTSANMLFMDTKHKVYVLTVKGRAGSSADQMAMERAENLNLKHAKGCVVILFDVHSQEFGFYATGDIREYITDNYKYNIVRSDAQFFLGQEKPGDAVYNVALSTIWTIGDGSNWKGGTGDDPLRAFLDKVGIALTGVAILVVLVWVVSLLVKYCIVRESIVFKKRRGYKSSFLTSPVRRRHYSSRRHRHKNYHHRSREK